MRKLHSPLLDLDLLIKKPDLHPYDIPQFEKAVLHINHNPVVSNKFAILPAISAGLDFTNQYPAVHTAKLSYASFNVRKGMQLSLLTTIRSINLLDLYYKFMFIILPQHLNSMESNSNNIFKILPNSGNFHIGISIFNKVSGNLIFILKSKGKSLDPKFKRIVFSFFNFPV